MNVWDCESGPMGLTVENIYDHAWLQWENSDMEKIAQFRACFKSLIKAMHERRNSRVRKKGLSRV